MPYLRNIMERPEQVHFRKDMKAVDEAAIANYTELDHDNGEDFVTYFSMTADNFRLIAELVENNEITMALSILQYLYFEEMERFSDLFSELIGATIDLDPDMRAKLERARDTNRQALVDRGWSDERIEKAVEETDARIRNRRHFLKEDDNEPTI